MKILTHKYVIYDNGWQFKWEEKEPCHLTIPCRELILWGVIIYLTYFK